MIGVDNIITDRPILAREVIRGRGKCGESAGAAEGIVTLKQDYRKYKNQENNMRFVLQRVKHASVKGRRRADRSIGRGIYGADGCQ